MLGPSNKWKTIQFTNKTISSEDFDEFHKVVLDGIRGNMSSLVQLSKYGTINTADPTIMGYYVINYRSEPYTLKKDQTTDGQVSKAHELAVKAEYLSFMKEKNWYCQQYGMNQSVII